MLDFVYETELCGQPLECEIEYEPAEYGGMDGPSYPATFSVYTVKVGGVDITGLVSESLIDEITEAAYDYFEGGQAEADNFSPSDED